MLLGSIFFKNKARSALKGKWQTALLVTFAAGLILTIAQVCQSVALRDVQAEINSLSAAINAMPEPAAEGSVQQQEILQLYQRLFMAVMAVPRSTLIGLLALNLAALVISPVLLVGCNRYFIACVDGEELSLREGVLGRVRIWHKVLWLHIVMFVKIFLWSLLFVIPGIIAGIRYSMAPYYMAENPQLSAREAIRRSKESMKNMKMTYFMLSISFVGWNLLITIAQIFLTDIHPVLSLVAAQFMSLAVNVYMNASFAAFYTGVSRSDGIEKLVRDMRGTMRQMGMDDTSMPDSAFGGIRVEEDEDKENENGGDQA